MLKSKYVYILSGVLITVLGIGSAIVFDSSAFAGDIFIPLVSNGAQRVDISADTKAQTIEIDSIQPGNRAPAENSYPSPVDHSTQRYPTIDEYNNDPSLHDTPYIVLEDGTLMQPPKNDPVADREYLEESGDKLLADGGVSVTVTELYGREFTLGGTAFRLPENIWVESLIMNISCPITTDESAPICPEAPLLVITDGNIYGAIQEMTGKVFLSPANDIELEEMERVFGFLRDQVEAQDFNLIVDYKRR